MPASLEQQEVLRRKLSETGLRHTSQRQLVYEVLLEQRDHPSAEEVFERVRTKVQGISLATIYNCLETLVQCGLVRPVNHERESTRYCPNLAPHAHFHDLKSGRVFDIDLPPAVLDEVKRVLPPGYQVEAVEISFHGQSAPEQTPS